MKIVAAALTLAALGTGPAEAREPDVLSVADVVARHIELDGQIVRVRGWIRECHGRSCGIYETRAGDWRAGHLSLGGAPEFDRRVQGHGLVQVELEARVHAVCFNDPMPAGVVEICADRVDQLADPRLVRILSSSTVN